VAQVYTLPCISSIRLQAAQQSRSQGCSGQCISYGSNNLPDDTLDVPAITPAISPPGG